MLVFDEQDPAIPEDQNIPGHLLRITNFSQHPGPPRLPNSSFAFHRFHADVEFTVSHTLICDSVTFEKYLQ